MPDLSLEIGRGRKQSLALKNPVMAASGTFGYGVEYARLWDVQRLGALISKGITVRPRQGNPPPRIWETPAGMLNAIGLQNVGLRAVVEEWAPLWATWRVPVVVNVAGESLEEYVELVSTLDGLPGVAAIELNISCPNVREGGACFADSPELAAEVTRVARAATSLPLIVKLSPNVTDIREVALAVEAAGADALSLVNTFVAMAIDVRRRRPVLANVTGGLSGPAIRPIAVRMVYQVAQVVRVPVIGIGGITCGEDALQFLMAGASAVQVGTASFVEPAAALRVLEELEAWCAAEGVERLEEIVGAALPAGVRGRCFREG